MQSRADFGELMCDVAHPTAQHDEEIAREYDSAFELTTLAASITPRRIASMNRDESIPSKPISSNRHGAVRPTE